MQRDIYREFTRVRAGKVPDAKTLGRVAQVLGPEVIEKMHARLVALAQEHKVIAGRRMRVDTMNLDQFAEFGRFAGFALADDFRLRFEDADQLPFAASAHALDEEGDQDRRGGRNQVARPQPQRAAAADGDWPGQPQQRLSGSGKSEVAL